MNCTRVLMRGSHQLDVATYRIVGPGIMDVCDFVYVEPRKINVKPQKNEKKMIMEG